MSDDNTNIRVIKCSQCGGQISLYGGDGVSSIVCQYCHTSLDAEESFKVLKKFLSLKRPDVPLRVGMTGTIKNIQFIIIGIVEYTEKDEEGQYPWVEFLLFSRTHGYAWLICENGHYIFGREIKDAPLRGLPGVERHSGKEQFSYKNQIFHLVERSSAEITYVEGELTWRVAVGDKIKYMDAVSPPYIFGIEESDNEREYFYGEYLPVEDVFRGFSMEGNVPQPKGPFPCQPFMGSPLIKAISNAGKVYAGVSLCLILLTLFFFKSETIFEQRIEIKSSRTAQYQFTVTNARDLLSIEISSPLFNAWAGFDAGISDEQSREIFSLTKTLSYYYGSEGGENWSEGAKSINAYFKVPRAERYKLTLSGEGEVDESNPSPSTSVIFNVVIKQGNKVLRYFLMLFAVMVVFALFSTIEKYSFVHRQQEEFDDEDEDDRDD